MSLLTIVSQDARSRDKVCVASKQVKASHFGDFNSDSEKR